MVVSPVTPFFSSFISLYSTGAITLLLLVFGRCCDGSGGRERSILQRRYPRFQWVLVALPLDLRLYSDPAPNSVIHHILHEPDFAIAVSSASSPGIDFNSFALRAAYIPSLVYPHPTRSLFYLSTRSPVVGRTSA